MNNYNNQYDNDSTVRPFSKYKINLEPKLNPGNIFLDYEIKNKREINEETNHVKKLNNFILKPQVKDCSFNINHNMNINLNKQIPFKMIKKSTLRKIDEKKLTEMLNIYESYNKKIRLIDILTMIIDISTICLFYFDHFEYIDNNYIITPASNLQRLILLVTTFLVCCGIVMRFKYRNKSETILINLGEINERDHKTGYKFLITEILIHLIQPYPFVKLEFSIKILGQDVLYSLNLLLFVISTIRVYILVKVIRYWNLYSKNRSKKILQFFTNDSNNDIFLYKANLSRSGFVTLVLLGLVTLFVTSMLLKVVEYTKQDTKNPFYYYWNSLWFLIVTMCTIGYGDITPSTVLGRFIGVIVCLIGVFILSLLVVTLTLFTDLDKDELAAFNQINSLSSTYNQKKEIQKYISDIMKYKIRYKLKKLDMECVNDKYFRNLQKNQVNILLKKSRANENTYTEFIKHLREISEIRLAEIQMCFKGMWQVEEEIEDHITINEDLSNLARKTKNYSMSCLNLAKCLLNVGSVMALDNIEQIQHKKLISNKDLFKAKNLYKNHYKYYESSLEFNSSSYDDDQNIFVDPNSSYKYNFFKTVIQSSEKNFN